MKAHLLGVIAIGAFALANPTAAQVVNGGNRDLSSQAPIGTKAPSTAASIQTPSEAANAAAGRENDQLAQHSISAQNHRRHRHARTSP